MYLYILLITLKDLNEILQVHADTVSTSNDLKEEDENAMEKTTFDEIIEPTKAKNS